MTVKTSTCGEYKFVQLKDGLTAIYASGGYWHVVDTFDNLVYGWVTAEFIRAN